MDRAEKFRLLASVLRTAAEKARHIAGDSTNGASRANALATQIEGIAMEFDIIADDVSKHV